MSKCPELDLISVYADEELPEIYKVQIEAHLAECESCRKIADEYKKLSKMFAEDNKYIDSKIPDLEKSFERLQARRSYSKVIKKDSFKLEIPSVPSGLKYSLTGIAAALVVALVLPLRMNNSKNQMQTNFQPVTRTQFSSPAENTAFENYNPSPYQNYASTVSNNSYGFENMPRFDHRKHSMPSHIRRPDLTGYDMFMPETPKENKDDSGLPFRENSDIINVSLGTGN